ncbi:MAG: DNA polymerase III subunit delta [Bacilli bacterium]|nr:DNA polymerase III subunit delta [Bacilli bacterium]
MANIYLLYGTDKGVINNELNKITVDINSSDIVRYPLDVVNIETIVMDISTISMFGDKRVVIVDNAYMFMSNKNIDSINILEDYVKNASDNNCLIFIVNSDKIDTRKKIYKCVKDKGRIIECKKGDSNYINSFVKDYLMNNNYIINDINYFLNVVGSDLDNIRNELDKLFMFCMDSKKITNEDIDIVCVKVVEEEIFSLTDAIILNNKDKAIELLEVFLRNNYDEVYILNLLSNQFRFLFQVKKLANKNNNYSEIAKILEVNPYRVKFTLNKLYNYTENDIIYRIKGLLDVDKSIKMGIMDKRLALELFILNN